MFFWSRSDERGRPWLVGLVVLLLFLTLTDIGSNNQTTRPAGQTLAAAPADRLRDDVRDKLLYEMSLANEKLEKENRALLTQALMLRSLLRQCRGRQNGSSSIAGAVGNVFLDKQIDQDLAAAQDSKLRHRPGPAAQQHSGEAGVGVEVGVAKMAPKR